MNNHAPDASWFAELNGNDLSAVVFVRDYVQLQFNPPPTLNVYTPIVVANGEGRFEKPHRDFANALIAQINKSVQGVRVTPGERVEITFQDGSSLEFSLRQADYAGPEAFEFFSQNGGVWSH